MSHLSGRLTKVLVYIRSAKKLTVVVLTGALVRALWNQLLMQKVSVNQHPSALFDGWSETGSCSCRVGVRVSISLLALRNQNGILV